MRCIAWRISRQRKCTRWPGTWRRPGDRIETELRPLCEKAICTQKKRWKARWRCWNEFPIPGTGDWRYGFSGRLPQEAAVGVAASLAAGDLEHDVARGVDRRACAAAQSPLGGDSSPPDAIGGARSVAGGAEAGADFRS